MGLSGLSLEEINKDLIQFENQDKTTKKTKKVYFYNIIEELLTTTSVKCISFVGTTPSFNDGDPCTHDEDAWLFTSSPLDEEQPKNEYEEDINYMLEDDSTYTSDLKDKETAEPLWDLLHKCNYGILEEKRGTNYCVKFYLGQDGKVVEDYEYCDRGY